MAKSLAQTLFSPLTALIQTNPYALVRKSDMAKVLEDNNNLQESLYSASAGQWITAAEVDDTADSRWRRIQQQAMAAYVADSVIKRIIDIYVEWCLAGGIRYSVSSDAGWASATIKRLWPNGFFDFFGQILFYWGIFGEFYFKPNLSIFGLDTYDLISPLEVVDMRQDTISKLVYFQRQWNEYQIDGSTGEMLIDISTHRRVYNSNECMVVKWNSPGNRGIPFVHPTIAWILMYNEWLKDRALANKMRSFAYLIKKITKPSGSAKVIADQFQSQLMKTTSYQSGSHTQYGYGYRKEKMPTGGILTCDAYTDWEALNFQIQGDDASPDGHAFRQQTCALTGIPESLLFGSEDARLDTSDSRIESFTKKIEYLRTTFGQLVNDILVHCRQVELIQNQSYAVRAAGRRVSTRVSFSFKPANAGERRFFADDATKSMAGGFLSRKSALEMSPFVGDPELEEKRIKEEANDDLTQSFLDRVAPDSNRDDENADLLKKQKDAAGGVRGQEYSQKKKTGAET